MKRLINFHMTNEWYIIHYYHYKTVVGVFLTKLKAQKKKTWQLQLQYNKLYYYETQSMTGDGFSTG